MARLAKFEDAAASASVHIRSWKAAYRGVLPDEFLDGLDLEARVLSHQRLIKSDEMGFLVAERENEVVGFSLLGKADDEGWGEVLAIYAVPEVWGTGVGHELMDASADWLVGAGFSRGLLWVIDSNDRAHDFYQRQGWSLGAKIRIEKIAGVDVNLVRFEKDPLGTL
jgi:GNAT superfamily N-acetyltransferase